MGGVPHNAECIASETGTNNPFTMCCRVLRLELAQLPNHTVIQLLKMLFYGVSVEAVHDGCWNSCCLTFAEEVEPLQSFLGH